MKIGPNYLGDGKCEFIVWAPVLNKVDLEIVHPHKKIISLTPIQSGYWKTVTDNINPDTQYFFKLNGEKSRPDPASHYQPNGVHQPSQIIDHSTFKWEDHGWNGIELSKMIMYELHVGTFTYGGTFEEIIPRLDKIKEIGVNTLSLMPVAQFPGDRNWGYDSVQPFAVQNSYGGPDGFKKLINECHKKGIAVILDVVYNHLGPEGNYFAEFGPYFTNKYKTHWGEAINYDGPYSDEVRKFFIQNAVHWFTHYHVDGLRLDAVHAIFDVSAHPFLRELTENVASLSEELNKKCYIIAESNLNDTKIIKSYESGGYGIDSQWCDDLHHCIHTLLTGETKGYYADYGDVKDIVRCYRDGYSLTGQYSKFRKRQHGVSAIDQPGEKFIVSSQTHDQVGNRMLGERLSVLVNFEALKLAAAAYIFPPFIPMLFMGEEYAENTPFLYFVSHNDHDLIEAVRKGRKDEFHSFNWEGEPPDPQSIDTFLKSKLDWEKRSQTYHKIMLEYYKNLLRLRGEIPALYYLKKENADVSGFEENKVVLLHRWYEKSEILLIMNLSQNISKIIVELSLGKWKKGLDSSEEKWNGPGSLIADHINTGDEISLSPYTSVLFVRE